MSYTGPGSVISVTDEFLAHWAGVNAALTPVFLTVIVEGTTVLKSRTDLQTLRTTYNAVQSQPSGLVVLPLPAPQFPSVQALRNAEENARKAAETGRGLVAEAIGAFNRKVRGTLAHTTYPNSLPAAPGAQEGNATLVAMADDMISVDRYTNGLPAGPLFTPPLIASYLPVGTSTPQPLTLSEAGTRLAGLKTSMQDILNAENGLQAMRPYRDGLWENEIRPLLVAYQKKVEGEFPPGHPLAQSLPSIYPAPGHTPDAVNATGAWNPGIDQADYSWSVSLETTLARYEVRMSPARSMMPMPPPPSPPSPPAASQFYSDAGLLTSGQTCSVKIFVVLTTGNERGSNTVTLTRP